jgi:hypothetical protein
MRYDTETESQTPSRQESETPQRDAPEAGSDFSEAQQPVNWFLLAADEAYAEWHDLDQWVKKVLRDSYGLPPTILPPYWHRHGELIWELSALHLLWRASYDSEAPPSAPTTWHREFVEARNRLREWVSLCGTRLDRDRPTRRTVWPGEPPIAPAPERVIADRDEDFEQFVLDDIAKRRQIEHRMA